MPTVDAAFDDRDQRSSGGACHEVPCLLSLQHVEHGRGRRHLRCVSRVVRRRGREARRVQLAVALGVANAWPSSHRACDRVDRVRLDVNLPHLEDGLSLVRVPGSEARCVRDGGRCILRALEADEQLDVGRVSAQLLSDGARGLDARVGRAASSDGDEREERLLRS